MKKLKLLSIYESLNGVERDVFEGFDEMELSEDYPESFDFNEFKDIRSYGGKLRYAETHLGKQLGSGSSRIVYRVDNNKVLKIAKNAKGIAQNEVEINWYGESYYDSIIANVIDYDRENSLWVEMELAFKVKNSDFERLWGVKIDDLKKYLSNMDRENHGKKGFYDIPTDIKYKLDESEDVNTLVSFMLDSDSPSGDLGRKSSWGLVNRKNGEYLVLVDFGLTNEVYQTYY